MPLFSASEDFTRRSLSAIPGLLSRLAYIASLRDEEGNYRHWGLARTHGSAAATEAMGRAHLEVLTKVLCTPLSQLMREVEDPQQAGLGALSHAKATILALRALEDARNWMQTSHRAA